MSKDYYNTIGVDKSASQDEIKKAFRKKAHECHPDKKGGDEAKFKELNEAYQVLGDEQKRKQYDQFGSGFQNGQAGGAGGFGGFEGFGGAGGFNINMDDLGDIFGGMGDIFGGGGRRSRKQARGSDIQTILSIDFMEAVFGVEKEVKMKKTIACDKCSGNGAEPGSKIETCKTCGGTGQVTKIQRTILGNMQVQAVCSDCSGEGKTYDKKCSKCSGTGVVQEIVNLKVKIPAGINNGETIRLSNQGEAGPKGSPAGDLYIKIRVNSDKRFDRQGYDIHTENEINFTQATLGDKINIETVDGPIKLKVPEGTQSGTIFKLRGKGVEKLQGRGKGNHFVKINIKTPSSLNKKQKELLKELNI